MSNDVAPKVGRRTDVGEPGSDAWWHLSFGVLFAVTAASFVFWSTGEISGKEHIVILLLTIAFGLFMAFNIGGNDVANSFGTSVGAGTLSMKQALIVAAVFEVGGAVLAGGEVTETVRSGIVDLDGMTLAPMDFAFIMMSALLGAAVWLLIATQMGWPVSTTHSIVGGIVGAAVTLGVVTGQGGWEMVQTLSRSTFVLFSWMQVFTACAFAFSHGSNDIANAVGPFAAVFDVLKTGAIGGEAAVPGALMLAAGIALVCGLWFIGRKVIMTVGEGLTKMHPANGFAAELSAAAVVMVASLLGLPVSSTHILIGAVLGVGLVNRAANWNLMKPIALAWVITLPAAAGIGAVTVVVLRAALG